MSPLGVILQEAVQREREAGTLLAFLREQMDGGVDGDRRGRMTLKERLGLKGLGCCGATWGFRPTGTTISVREDDDEEEEQQQREVRGEPQLINAEGSAAAAAGGPHCPGSSMNLAAALAAERQLREGTPVSGDQVVGMGTPMRVSLMRLLEETEEVDVGGSCRRGGGGNDTVCCVCMVRKKGAAFIPCGHTFCRVCSRELWLNRGCCPLCNRSILEILDIF
ncbi:hypothetical protein Tsubulata_047934 [Turnera subulata]|uniref:RING-type domain-containing protein n=1 Tax=Turnera subulata TaxID=218843 RepID=A0A9Q0FYY3_9ROSI|nr:hypothetical protein Tsubulata_047934 [Turnera subulata]